MVIEYTRKNYVQPFRNMLPVRVMSWCCPMGQELVRLIVTCKCKTVESIFLNARKCHRMLGLVKAYYSLAYNLRVICNYCAHIHSLVCFLPVIDLQQANPNLLLT